MDAIFERVGVGQAVFGDFGSEEKRRHQVKIEVRGHRVRFEEFLKNFTDRGSLNYYFELRFKISIN